MPSGHRTETPQIRVTIVCEGFSLSSLSFQPWHRIYEISRRMLRRTVLVSILSDGKTHEDASETIGGIRISRMSHPMLAPLTNKKQLASILRNSADIVVWHGSPSSALYLIRLKSIGIPLVWDIDTDLRSFKMFRVISLRELLHPHHNLLLREMLAAICPRSIIRIVANSPLVSRIVVPSSHLKRSLCRIGVLESKIAVIPSTVETPEVRSQAGDKGMEKLRTELGFRANDFIVAYVGPPCSLRGVDTAIYGMRIIGMRLKNAKLVILARRALGGGTVDRYLGNEEEWLRNLVRKQGLAQHVRILPGLLDKDTLTRYECASDVVALPFKVMFSEPPLSVLEAMSLGKVVLSTNLGSLVEILGKDRGVLIEPGEAGAFAEAVLFLAEHPRVSASIGANAQRFAAGLPDWDSVALEFEKVLAEVFASGGQGLC